MARAGAQRVRALFDVRVTAKQVREVYARILERPPAPV
jgi:hypothetical protein